jgi:hypothetical protein
MAPLDPTVRQVVDELANALQAIVLITEHLKLASSATAQDAKALSRSLQRVTAALRKLPSSGGGL